MNDELLIGMTFVSAIGCGLMAGVFFAFSTFVMQALARLPPAQGIAAMQSINVAVVNLRFMALFLGTAVACLLLAVMSVLKWHAPGVSYLLAGSLLFLIGTVLVTIVFNVPRNDALAAIEPAATDAAQTWASYITSWTFWNNLRAAAAGSAAVLFTLALSL